MRHPRADTKSPSGADFTEVTVLAIIEGPAQGVLRAERVALKFVQRMSCIATQTAQYVSAVAGTRARIIYTRKTTPGLRLIERYVVRCDGGDNPRYSLSDAVMVKDNQLAILAADGGGNLTEALQSMRARLPHTRHIEVEVDRPEKIECGPRPKKVERW